MTALPRSLPLLCAALLAIACNPGSPGGGDPGGAAAAAVPSEPPSITGVVTAVGPGRTLRIEERPEDASGSAKAQVRVPEGVTIVERGGRARRLEEVQRGARVSAWFTGPVAESYPVQATARLLVIEATAP